MTDPNKKKVSGVHISEKKIRIHQSNELKNSAKSTAPRFGCRHVQVVLLCLGIVFGISTRTNLSVAVIAMTDNTTSPNPNIPSYNWNNTSITLSSFFWGYISLQVIAGYLGKTYGPKYFLLVTFFLNCCACAFTPLAAEKFGSTGVMLCRIIQGLGQGFLYPMVNVLLGRWAPEQERTTLCNIVFSGKEIGSIFASLVTGYISVSWWGWPVSFYLLSGMGVCWCIAWLCFGQNSPSVHPRISDEERTYIQSSLKQEDNTNLPTPWKKILTCVPFYALMVALIGNLWGYSILMTETPTYLSKVINFDVKSSYNWNNTSITLSSFFWGYISLQVIAGYLGKTYGPKYFLLVTFFLNCCACAFTPLAAEKFGSTGVMLCRIIQGLGQGFLYPMVNVLLGRWAPEQERTTLCNIVFSGKEIGSIFASLVTGYISVSWWGWPVSFYLLSGMGVCWCIAWLCFGQNSPSVHPRISDEERTYIQSSLKQEDNTNLPTPWKKILTCVPFYALMVALIGNLWGYSILMTETPTYLSKVINFDVKSNAVVSSMPTAVTLITSLIMGPLSDWIISRKILSTLNARRIFHLIGSYGQALCVIWLSFLKSSQAPWSVFVLGLGNALLGFVMVGCNVNHLDLSPRFSGVIFGIVNAVGQGVAILGPLTANWIVTDPSNVSQWQCVFLIAGGFYIVGGTVFFFFASASRQPWDGPVNPRQEERRKKNSVVSLMSY